MNRRSLMQSVGAIALAAIAGGGCGGGDGTMDPEQDVTSGRLPFEEIGAMYRKFVKENNRPPKGIADFEKYALDMSFGYDGLKRGDQEVFWGTPIEASESGQRTVLAHQKQAATEGGYVLMKDGTTVKKLTAEEFQAAPKAK